jgi:hypothetical protein
MNIDIINNIQKAYGLKNSGNSRKPSSKGEKNVRSENVVNKSDSLVISGDVKKINMIQSKLNNKYYDNNEVFKEVANRLLEYSEL